jgi:hypothetical protein
MYFIKKWFLLFCAAFGSALFLLTDTGLIFVEHVISPFIAESFGRGMQHWPSRWKGLLAALICWALFTGLLFMLLKLESLRSR